MKGAKGREASLGTSKALPGQVGYREWFKAEQRFRLIACAVWYAVVVVCVANLFRLAIPGSFRLSALFSFSLRNIGLLLLFSASQIFVLGAQSLTLTVDARLGPLLGTPLSFRALAASSLVVLSFLVSALLGTWCFVALSNPAGAASMPMAPGDLPVAVFALVCALRSFQRQDTLLRFPSIQLPRALRLRTKMMPVLRAAGVEALQFTAAWHILFGWLLPLVTPALWQPSLVAAASTGFLRLFLLLFLLGVCWTLAVEMLQIFSTEVLPFNQYLLHGLADARRPARFLAFACLADLAEFSPQDRQYLYDQHPLFPGQPLPVATWAPLCGALVHCLQALSEALYEQALLPASKGRWGQPSPAQRTAELFRDLPLAIWSCQALAALATAARAEDEQGVVEASLETVLGALLTCSCAIKEYVRCPSFVRQSDLVALGGAQLARPVPMVLGRHLDNALQRITHHFYNELSHVQLPPEQADALQEYADVCR